MPKKVKIRATQYILKDLDNHIQNREPFSLIRLGDGVLGSIASGFTRKIVKDGPWSTGRAHRKFFRKHGMNTPDGLNLLRRIINYSNEANYIDCLEAMFLLPPPLRWPTPGMKINMKQLADRWRVLHNEVGINNKFYCNPFIHCFMMIDGEYNIFDIIKNRNIFCITCVDRAIDRLYKLKITKKLAFQKIPGDRVAHTRRHYENVKSLVTKEANNYDLFLVGAGLLGKEYCGLIKSKGGRAIDVGRMFNMFLGNRMYTICEPLLKINKKKMLFERTQRQVNSPVW